MAAAGVVEVITRERRTPVLEHSDQATPLQMGPELVSTLSLILLAVGVAGFIGTIVVASFIKRGLHRTLIAIPILMAAIALALIPMGVWVWPVAVLLAMWGLLGTAAPVGWWSWLAQTLPNDAEAGGGLMVAVIQLAIALGSTFGGLLFDTSGYRSTFVASAAVLMLAAFLTLRTSRAQAPRAPNRETRHAAK